MGGGSSGFRDFLRECSVRGARGMLYLSVTHRRHILRTAREGIGEGENASMERCGMVVLFSSIQARCCEQNCPFAAQHNTAQDDTASRAQHGTA
jgi:hypothetical protein